MLDRMACGETAEVARLVVHLWVLGEHPSVVVRLLWGLSPRMRGVPMVDEDDYSLEYVGKFYQEEESDGYGRANYAGGSSI